MELQLARDVLPEDLLLVIEEVRWFVSEGIDPELSVSAEGDLVKIGMEVRKTKQGDLVKKIHRAIVDQLASYSDLSFQFHSPPAKPKYTVTQGQYLAFIHHYIKMNRQAPSFDEIGKYFYAAPSSVNQMIKTLVSKGLISKEAGVSRSIRLLIDEKDLPELR